MTIDFRDNLLLHGVKKPHVGISQESGTTRQPDGIFSGQLDRALEPDGQNPPASPAQAQTIAERLSLHMLHTSLSLATDNSDDNATSSMPFDLPGRQIQSLLKVYSANQPEATPAAHETAEASQLQDMDITPVASDRLSSGHHWLDSVISRASKRYGVETGLIKAVIQAESNFNPNAVSHAGAQGLMQLMPATARSLGVNDSFDPEQNVMAGTRFLGDLLKRYNGDLDSALAAYNWGPGNVDKRPERLPRETRNYLARVKQLYSSYTA